MNWTLGNAEKELCLPLCIPESKYFAASQNLLVWNTGQLEFFAYHTSASVGRVFFFSQTSCNLGTLSLLGYLVAWHTKDVKDEELLLQKCLLVIWFYCGCWGFIPHWENRIYSSLKLHKQGNVHGKSQSDLKFGQLFCEDFIKTIEPEHLNLL